MSKRNKALTETFTPLAQCPPEGIVLRIFPVGKPTQEKEAICFESAKSLKNYLKKHPVPDGMAYGIRDADLSGLVIKTLDLHNGYLENVNLSGAQIRLAAFAGATLKNVNFAHADLKQLNLRDGMAVDCNFSAVQLPGCNMIRALAKDCDFRYAAMGGALLREVEFDGGKLDGADMAGADMAQARMKQVTAQKMNLANVHMEGGEFTEADLTGTDMQYAHMDEMRMIACNLKDVKISGRETARGMALAGCDHDYVFAPIMGGEALYNPRVGAKSLWALRKQHKPQ